MCGQPAWNQGSRGKRSRLGYPAVLQCRVVFRSRWARDVSVDGPHSSAGKLMGWRGPRLPGCLLWWHGGQGPATLFHAGLQVRASLCLGARGPRWWERNQNSYFSRIWAARELTQQRGVGALPGGSHVDSVASEVGKARKGSGYMVADSPCPDVRVWRLS